MGRQRNQTRTDILARIDERKEEMRAYYAKIEQLKLKDSKAELWLRENPEIDTSDLDKAVNDATNKNSDNNKKIKLQNNIELFNELSEESGELTALIDSSKEALKDAIKDMDTPVKGLAYDMEGLLYNGNPVHPGVLSTAEIGYLGAQLKIAENPDLGVLFIQNGQSYGTKRLKQLQDLGCQIIMEEVKRGQEKLTVEIMAA